MKKIDDSKIGFFRKILLKILTKLQEKVLRRYIATHMDGEREEKWQNILMWLSELHFKIYFGKSIERFERDSVEIKSYTKRCIDMIISMRNRIKEK